MKCRTEVTNVKKDPEKTFIKKSKKKSEKKMKK